MKIQEFPPRKIKNISKIVIAFLQKYGDGRITHHALRWFKSLTEENTDKGTFIAAMVKDKKPLGIIVFGDYGLTESFIAVHPSYRSQGIGEKLLLFSIEKLGKVYTRVACDNTKSLKLCFACNMAAIHLIKGPTGKSTLWLAGGDWNKEDLTISNDKQQSKV